MSMSRKRGAMLAGAIILAVAAWLSGRAPPPAGSAPEEAKAESQVASRTAARPDRKPLAKSQLPGSGGFLLATVRGRGSPAPVESCTISCGTGTFACDSAGRAVIGPLSGTQEQLKVEAPGYASQELTVTLSGEHDSVDILLLRGGEISGRVFDAEHHPAPAIQVHTVHHTLKRPRPFESFAITDADGHYVLVDVVAGVVGVRAQAPGRIIRSDDPPAPQEARVLAEASTPDFDLFPGQRRDGVDLTFSMGGSLSGVVVDAEGRPVNGISVFADDKRNRTLAGFDDNTSGSSFHIEGLAEGDFAVRAEARGGSRDGGHAFLPSVHVHAGADTTLRLVLVAEFIDGTVHDGRGLPVAGATISAGWEGGSKSDVAGHFRLSPLSAGPYRIRASADGRSEVVFPVVRAGAHLDITMDTGGKVTGVVRSNVPHPPDSFTLRLVPTGGLHPETIASGYRVVRIVSSRGTFEIGDVPAGKYDVRVSVDDGTSGDASIDVTSGGTTDVAINVEVPTVFKWKGIPDTLSTEPSSSLVPQDNETTAPTIVDPEFDEHTTGPPPPLPADRQFVGVGITWGGDPDSRGATRVFEGSPAFLAGVQEGDVLLSVNGSPVQGMDIADILQMTRGPVGALLDLGLLRPSTGSTFDVSIERALVTQ